MNNTEMIKIRRLPARKLKLLKDKKISYNVLQECGTAYWRRWELGIILKECAVLNFNKSFMWQYYLTHFQKMSAS